MVLAPAWSGRLPGPVPALVEVVDRLGVDLAPVDVTTAAGARRLESYVWPDQPDRLRRLRGAVALARTVPATLRRQNASLALDALTPATGVLTVHWHSVMWQYLAADDQRRCGARIAEIAAAATQAAPFVHIAFEPRRLTDGGRHRFVVSARRSPGGPDRLVGEAPPHGIGVRWGSPGR